MKVTYSILILAAGLAGILLPGCATSKPSPSGGLPTISGAVVAGGDDLADAAPQGASQGNPDSLAHYAAGVSYEWNDEDEKAVKQFYDSALADPANEPLVIKVAERYIKFKQPDKAAILLAKSARRSGASALLLSWLARADIQIGKTNQALAASRLAIRKQPDGYDGYESQLEILFHNNQLTEAAQTLNKAAKAVRAEPATLVALGGLYGIYLKARPNDAVMRTNAMALLDRVDKMNFSSPRLWQTLADTYRQLDQPKKAAAIYLKLLSDSPNAPALRESLHEKLAGIYFQTEDKTNAMKQLEAIVRDNPTRYPRAWFFLGELAFADDKLSEAADDYENALHWDPSIDEAYYKLALTQIAMHRAEDAFKTLALARARFPKTFACNFYTGVAYLQVRNFGEAIHNFGEAEVIALATNPKLLDYRFYYQFGEACERNQQFKQADEYLQKCIKLNPGFGEALNYLGYMLADRGEDLSRARGLIEKAVQLEPKNGAYLDSLAWVLFKQNQAQAALPWLLKAVELSPEPDATVLDHLGEIYMALHQPAKAIEAWKKSFSIEADPQVKKKLDSHTGGA